MLVGFAPQTKEWMLLCTLIPVPVYGTVLTLMLESEEIGVRALMKQLLKMFYSHKLRSYGKAR